GPLRPEDGPGPTARRPAGAPNKRRVVRRTLRLNAGVVITDYLDGPSSTLSLVYNGRPRPGRYMARLRPTGRYTLVPSPGGTPKGKGYVAEWRDPEDVATASDSYEFLVLDAPPPIFASVPAPPVQPEALTPEEQETWRQMVEMMERAQPNAREKATELIR